MPAWYWVITIGLGFVATLLIAAGMAYGREWPAKLLDFLGMTIGAWGVAMALGGGVVKLIAWLT